MCGYVVNRLYIQCAKRPAFAIIAVKPMNVISITVLLLMIQFCFNISTTAIRACCFDVLFLGIYLQIYAQYP